MVEGLCANSCRSTFPSIPKKRPSISRRRGRPGRIPKPRGVRASVIAEFGLSLPDPSVTFSREAFEVQAERVRAHTTLPACAI